MAGGLAIWASFGSRVFDFGAGFGVVDFNNAVTSWGSAMFVEALATGILMFTILGIVDTRSPEGWAGLVIGLVVVAIIITVGPLTNASINPARALGPLIVSDLNGSFHNWTEQLLAYIPANLVGAALAAFAYDWVAKPGSSQRPIREAVTEPDRADVVRDSRPRLGRGDEQHGCRDRQEVPQQPGRPRPRVARRARGRPLRSSDRRSRESDRRPQGSPGERQGRPGLGRGSGHEPLHGGFVGVGMLDAACPGAVFTSPVPDQMLAATKAVDGGAGVVHIVKNYTGDVLNFRMAAELAEDEGIQVESVLTNDDVAVEDSLYTAGRRGVGVTVLVEKIAGAKAEAGGTLAEVAGIARKVNAQGRSFGVALTSCATPTPTARSSRSARTRWSSASASTASRAGNGTASSLPRRSSSR